jgi:hypothetical protein
MERIGTPNTHQESESRLTRFIFRRSMSRTNELLNQIQTAQSELEQIRSKCEHKEGYHLGMWSWRPGTIIPSRICNSCQSQIGGITEKEEIQCQVENNSLYSDMGEMGLFGIPISLKQYEGRFIAYTYFKGVVLVEDNFEDFYEKYKSLDVKHFINFAKVILRPTNEY